MEVGEDGREWDGRREFDDVEEVEGWDEAECRVRK